MIGSGLEFRVVDLYEHRGRIDESVEEIGASWIVLLEMHCVV